MPLTDTHANEMLALEFQNTAVLGLGDASGLQGSAVAGSYYLSLHTTYPTETGDQTTNEASYTGYARTGVARDGTNWTVASRSATNANQIQFSQNTGNDEVITYVGLGDDLTGSGKLRRIAIIGNNANLGAMTVDAATNVITIRDHGLSVDDRVAFFNLPGLSIPTGITEGTVYYVLTAPDADTITISLSSGGSVIDITADGGAQAYKVQPLTVRGSLGGSGASDTPVIAATTLTLIK